MEKAQNTPLDGAGTPAVRKEVERSFGSFTIPRSQPDTNTKLYLCLNTSSSLISEVFFQEEISASSEGDSVKLPTDH